jgi:hypothetical protein
MLQMQKKSGLKSGVIDINTGTSLSLLVPLPLLPDLLLLFFSLLLFPLLLLLSDPELSAVDEEVDLRSRFIFPPFLSSACSAAIFSFLAESFLISLSRMPALACVSAMAIFSSGGVTGLAAAAANTSGLPPSFFNSCSRSLRRRSISSSSSTSSSMSISKSTSSLSLFFSSFFLSASALDLSSRSPPPPRLWSRSRSYGRRRLSRSLPPPPPRLLPGRRRPDRSRSRRSRDRSRSRFVRSLPSFHRSLGTSR